MRFGALAIDLLQLRDWKAGIVGVNAGELIAKLCLALEMQANVEDLALTIAPHPSLSETPMFAAEVALGSITDLYLPRN
jgi:dihydrolipoamide dehydrogenase